METGSSWLSNRTRSNGQKLMGRKLHVNMRNNLVTEYDRNRLPTEVVFFLTWKYSKADWKKILSNVL